MTLLLRISPVVDAHLLVRVVELPIFVLVLLVKIDDEKWMFEVDEEVTHVRVLLRFFLIGDDVEVAIPVLVGPVDLLLELLFIVAAGDIFDAKVCT